jgi:hypothetical protein
METKLKNYTCVICLNDFEGVKRKKNFPTVCASCKKGTPTTTTSKPDISTTPTLEVHDALFIDKITTLDKLEGKFDKLEQLATQDIVDTLSLDRKITLLARLIIEKVLWDSEGLSKKEKFDSAIRAIQVIEGGKTAIWVKDGDDKNLPKSQQQFFDEKTRIEKRIVSLVDKYKLGKVRKIDLVQGAADVIENEGEN